MRFTFVLAIDLIFFKLMFPEASQINLLFTNFRHFLICLLFMLSSKTTSIFSVDVAPGEGGELVHSYFDAKYTEGDQVNEWRGMELWYIVDGKVVWVNGYYQDIPEQE